MKLKFSITQFGKRLSKSKYTWDEKTRTFSTEESNLVLDFTNISGCTFKTGWNCTFDTGSGCTFNTGSSCTFNTDSDCTFKTGSSCTFNTGWNCTFDTGSGCTFKTGWNCTFDTDSDCTFNTDSDCTFKTGSDCTFKTGSSCTFNTGWNCTFKTGWNCTFDTGSGCTFKTGWNCTFNTDSDCTFNTDSGCTFKTGWNCTFDTGSGCTFNTGSSCTFNTDSDCTFNTDSDSVVIRRDDIFEIINLPENKVLTLAPYNIEGYVLDGFYYKDGKKQYKAIIADGILSKIITKKTLKNLTVYKVINHSEEDESYLVYDGENYSHGEILHQAKDDLIYKLSNRDTTQYESYTLDTTLSLKEAIQMYRTITGACEGGTKLFVNGLKEVKDKYSVKEVIELTKGQWNHNLLCEFFKERSEV